MYAPLYLKTDNSLLSSMIKIEELIEYAKKNNIKALAITDQNMYGAYQFYQLCKQNDIKPIIGLEIEIENQIILLYAKNYSGYQNLIKINLEANNFETLNQYSQNIICIVPFQSLTIYQKLNKIFKDIYQGFSDKEEEVVENPIFIKKSLYLTKAEKHYIRYLEAIKKGLLLEEINPSKEDYHLLLESEISFDLKANYQFVDMINLEIPFVKNSIPKFSDDSYQLLKDLTKKGMRIRFGDIVSKKYVERLKYELKIIKQTGFSDYFLIVYDFIQYAKKEKILVGPGRGSAASSLVSYCLFITDVDPIKYDLVFERFLNPERISMPDIDIDFEDERRDEVIAYCIKKYGEKKVVPIITFGTMGSKQVIRDIGRIMGINLNFINRLSKLIDVNQNLSENYQNKKIKDLLELDPEYKTFYQIAEKFEGLKRHTSIHAAGIIIAQDDLDQVIPLEKRDEQYISAYSMDYLEALGLLKMDFLGLKNLTIISRILKKVNLEFSEIPLEDEATIKLFQNGDTLGVFQFESSGMINFLKNLKATCFADIYAAIALFRPGPIKNIDLFVKRKKGIEKIDFIDPALEPILKSTYGVIVYQEQIMAIANQMAGYSMGEADVLRKAMSKKNTLLMEQEKEKFIQKAKSLNYSEATANQVFNLIARFADYGFNKAHSVSYAMIAFKMAYLKTHYPLEFMTVYLDSIRGNDEKIRQAINELKKRDIKVIGPNVGNASFDYQQKDNQIQMPISIIKGLGHQAINKIISQKPFKDIFDFVSRVYGKEVTKKEIELLTFSGAFDKLGVNRKTIICNLDKLLNYGELNDYDLKPNLKEELEYNSEELVSQEQQSLGFFLREHPVTKYKLENNNQINFNQVEDYFNKNITAIGIIDKLKEIKTKNGQPMAFVTLSDEFSKLDVVIFPDVYQSISLEIGQIVKMIGRVEKRHADLQLIVKKIEKI